MTMTLTQVRDVLINEAEWYESRLGDYKTPDFRAMAESLTAHLSQPQPVAHGEAVGCESDMRYDAGFEAGWHKAKERFATPTIPTGHRVVPVERDGEVSKYKDALTDIQARVASGYFVDANHLGEIAKKALGDGNND